MSGQLQPNIPEASLEKNLGNGSSLLKMMVDMNVYFKIPFKNILLFEQ